MLHVTCELVTVTMFWFKKLIFTKISSSLNFYFLFAFLFLFGSDSFKF